MKAKLLHISNNSAIIVCHDEYGTPLAYVVDSDLIPVRRPGDEFIMPNDAMNKSTPYGIDLSVIYPQGIYINANDFQSRLYASGVISLDDLKRKPSAINQVLISMIGTLSAEIYKTIKVAMEDYNDKL